MSIEYLKPIPIGDAIAKVKADIQAWKDMTDEEKVNRFFEMTRPPEREFVLSPNDTYTAGLLLKHELIDQGTYDGFMKEHEQFKKLELALAPLSKPIPIEEYKAVLRSVYGTTHEVRQAKSTIKKADSNP